MAQETGRSTPTDMTNVGRWPGPLDLTAVKLHGAEQAVDIEEAVDVGQRALESMRLDGELKVAGVPRLQLERLRLIAMAGGFASMGAKPEELAQLLPEPLKPLPTVSEMFSQIGSGFMERLQNSPALERQSIVTDVAGHDLY